jgi:hypothetical protein
LPAAEDLQFANCSLSFSHEAALCGLNTRGQVPACAHALRHIGINPACNCGGGWNAGRHSNTTGAESLGLATPVSTRQVHNCRVTPPKTVCGTRVANQLLSRKPLNPARPFLGTGGRHQFTIGKPNASPTPLEPIGPSKLLRDMVWGLGRFRHIWPYTFLIAGALATVAWTAVLGYALVTLVLTAL